MQPRRRATDAQREARLQRLDTLLAWVVVPLLLWWGLWMVAASALLAAG